MPRGRQFARFSPGGIVQDVNPESVGNENWTRARDVIFREHTERVKGLEDVGGVPAFRPEHVQFSRDASDIPVWLYEAAAGAAVWDGALHTDITPANWLTPTIDNPWTGGVLNSIPVVGSRRFWYWDGVGVLQDLPDWGATTFAQAMRPYKFHLIAMGIVNAGAYLEDAVWWSAAAAPGQIPQSWTPSPTNEAGSTELAQTGGECVDGAQLRGSFILYKDTSTYVMDYVGGSQVMATRLLYPEQGVLARNCIAELSNNHFVLTDGDVLRHDGQVQVSAIDGTNRRHLFNNISGLNSRNSFVVSNESAGEVWVCVPEEGADYPSLAYVFHKRTGRWGVRDLPEQPAHIAPGQVRLVPVNVSWDSDPDAWDVDPSSWESGAGRVDYYDLLEAVPGGAGDDGALMFVDSEPTRLGAPVTAVVAKEQMDLGDPMAVKTIKRVWLQASGTPGSVLRVRVAGTDDPAEDPQYGAYAPFVIGSQEKVDVFSTGKYLSVEVSSDDAQVVEPWRLSSFSIEYDRRGAF